MYIGKRKNIILQYKAAAFKSSLIVVKREQEQIGF
jgi:hypothetical protein